MILLLLFTLLLCICSLSSAQTRCTEEQACSAVCNGETIDISFLYDKLSLEGNRGYMYVFSCKGDPCGEKNTSSVICQRASANPHDSHSCGASNSSIWTVLSTDPFVLNITYHGGDSDNVKSPRSSFVNITVNQNLSEANIAFGGEQQGGGFYVFDFNIPSITAPKSKSKAPTEGYIGWILIVLSLIGFILYFVIGSIIMRFRRGARGIEMIPHVTFWRSFPFLLKDGCLFTISPISRRFKGYDRI